MLASFIRHTPVFVALFCVSISLPAQGVVGSSGNPDPLTFTISADRQVDGDRVFRAVESFWHHKERWQGAPDGFEPDPVWLRERTEGVIRFMSGDYGMANVKANYRIDGEGNFKFVPPPDFVEMLDRWAGQEDIGIWMNLGTNCIPEPLIEGGYKADDYNYNVRQPNDYEKWSGWLTSMFEFLIDRYGREEVQRWVFQFGFESDWQTRCVKPGTQELMSKQENRREFMKMLDYFHATAEETIGGGAAVACYFALITQADDYFRHWATGTNFRTGKTGTRISMVGFSDWYHIGPEPAGKWYDPMTFRMSPFTLDQKGDGNAHGNAYVGGMQFKYNYLLRLIARYPELEYLQFYLPESGYIQIGSTHPAPLTYADHQGAVLYALRTMAFAHFPRIIMAGNNFALNTGDRGAWYQDEVKPPVFNALRIQNRLAGERMLPVGRSGTQQAETEIRAVASASDDEQGLLRLLLVNFNYLFHISPENGDRNTETVRLRLAGLPAGVESVSVTPYLIDKTHNNWWTDWTRFREEEGIRYATSGYGVWAKYDVKYAPFVNDPMGTLAPKDRKRWLEKSLEYREVDDFRPTGPVFTVPVVDGVAELHATLKESDTAYLEVRLGPADRVDGLNLDFSDGLQKRWRLIGDAVSDAGEVHLLQGESGSELRQTIEGLDPETSYSFIAEAKTDARNLAYGIFAERPGGEGESMIAGVRDAQWKRLVVTTESDHLGKLVIGLKVPGQPVPSDCGARFRKLSLVRHSGSGN